MNNQYQNNGQPNRPMGGKFCSQCGRPLDENKVCRYCQENANTNQQFSATQRQVNQPNTQAPYNNQNHSQQEEPSAPTIFSYALDYVRVFFSRTPFAAIENIVKTNDNIWIVIGSIVVVLISIGLFGVCSQNIYDSNFTAIILYLFYVAFYDVSDLDAAFSSANITWVNDEFKLFMFLLLTVLLQFFASAGIVYLVVSVNRKKVNFVRTLNMVSISLLPLALAGVIAFVAAYVNILAACIVLLTGLILVYIQLYYGMQKAIKFNKSPFWSFAFLIIADIVSFFLIAMIIYKIFC